jgi:hypothetical protein
LKTASTPQKHPPEKTAVARSLPAACAKAPLDARPHETLATSKSVKIQFIRVVIVLVSPISDSAFMMLTYISNAADLGPVPAAG